MFYRSNKTGRFSFVLLGLRDYVKRTWHYKVRYHSSPQRRISPRRSSDDGRKSVLHSTRTWRHCAIIFLHLHAGPQTYLAWRVPALQRARVCKHHGRTRLVQVDLLIRSKLFRWYSLAWPFRINKAEVGASFFNENILSCHLIINHS